MCVRGRLTQSPAPFKAVAIRLRLWKSKPNVGLQFPLRHCDLGVRLFRLKQKPLRERISPTETLNSTKIGVGRMQLRAVFDRQGRQMQVGECVILARGLGHKNFKNSDVMPTGSDNLATPVLQPNFHDIPSLVRFERAGENTGFGGKLEKRKDDVPSQPDGFAFIDQIAPPTIGGAVTWRVGIDDLNEDARIGNDQNRRRIEGFRGSAEVDFSGPSATTWLDFSKSISRFQPM